MLARLSVAHAREVLTHLQARRFVQRAPLARTQPLWVHRRAQRAPLARFLTQVRLLALLAVQVPLVLLRRQSLAHYAPPELSVQPPPPSRARVCVLPAHQDFSVVKGRRLPQEQYAHAVFTAPSVTPLRVPSLVRLLVRVVEEATAHNRPQLRYFLHQATF
jgi:hypothetical protein